MEVLLAIAASLFVIGLLAGLLLVARKLAVGRTVSLGLRGKRRLFAFPLGLNPGGDSQKSLYVLNQVALTPSHRLHLLLVTGEKVLLCTHPQGCTVIPAARSELELKPPTAQSGERSVG